MKPICSSFLFTSRKWCRAVVSIFAKRANTSNAKRARQISSKHSTKPFNFLLKESISWKLPSKTRLGNHRRTFQQQSITKTWSNGWFMIDRIQFGDNLASQYTYKASQHIRSNDATELYIHILYCPCNDDAYTKEHPYPQFISQLSRSNDAIF